MVLISAPRHGLEPKQRATVATNVLLLAMPPRALQAAAAGNRVDNVTLSWAHPQVAQLLLLATG